MLHYMLRAEASVAECSDDECEAKGSDDGCDPENCVTIIQLLINAWFKRDSCILSTELLSCCCSQESLDSTLIAFS